MKILMRKNHKKLRRSQRWLSRQQLRLQNREMYCSWECCMLLFSSHFARFIWIVDDKSECNMGVAGFNWASVKIYDVWFILTHYVACCCRSWDAKTLENDGKFWKWYLSFSRFWSQTNKPQVRPLTCVWQAVADRNVFSRFKLSPTRSNVTVSAFRSGSYAERYPVFATKASQPTQLARRHTRLLQHFRRSIPELNKDKQSTHVSDTPFNLQNPESWKSAGKSRMLQVSTAVHLIWDNLGICSCLANLASEGVTGT